MKRIHKISPIICVTAFCAVALAGPSAKANLITGSIGFGASGITVDNSNLALATTFSVSNPFTTVETGTYSTVPMFTPVTFNGFKFNPAVASITPLWTFDIGPVGNQTVYSFDATTVTAMYNAPLHEWDIGGNGMAMVTGFTTTPGTWNVNVSQSGASFVFDSSEAAAAISVPDGGSTAILLGGSFLCVAGIGQKLKKQ